MQTAPIKGKIKHLLCLDCVQAKLAHDPRTTHPDAWVEAHYCHLHRLSQAFKRDTK